MASRVDQVVMMALTDIERDGVIDINEFLKTQLQHGRDVWCRIPNQLQAYLRTVSLGMRGEELRTEYFPLSSDRRYLSVGDEVMRELLAVGQSVVSVTEVIASIDERLELIKLNPEDADFERWKKETFEKHSFIDTLRIPSRRAMRTQKVFVIGVSSGDNNDGVVSGQVMEQSFSIKLSDLFALKADYKKYLSEAQGPDVVSFTQEWMPEELRRLNRRAAAYHQNHESPDKGSSDNEALQQLRIDLANDLNVRNPNGSKVGNAIKIVIGKREYYPKAPVKAISGEEKVSLLDIANALAEAHWKGSVEETQRVYAADVERFNQSVEQLLKDHGVIKPAALSRELSRFVRFCR